MRSKIESVAAAIRAGSLQLDPTKPDMLKTRRQVVAGWLRAQEILRAVGSERIAHEVERFVSDMPPPQTERERIAQVILSRTRKDQREVEILPER
jgi:hypothetical protein